MDLVLALGLCPDSDRAGQTLELAVADLAGLQEQNLATAAVMLTCLITRRTPHLDFQGAGGVLGFVGKDLGGEVHDAVGDGRQRGGGQR